MNPSYLQRKVNPWISAAVLAGGLLSAILLIFVERVQSNAIASTGNTVNIDDSAWSGIHATNQ